MPETTISAGDRARRPENDPRPPRRALALALSLTAGCASAVEQALPAPDTPLEAWRAPAATPPDGARAEPTDGRAPGPADELDAWVARAALASPSLRALHDRWRAARLRVAPARRLPDPMLSYAWYARSVETRVGPQRHRLSVRQDVPWPGRLGAQGEAAAEAADAAGRALEAGMLTLRRDVADAWWQLWRIRAEHAVDRRQEALLEALVDATRAAVEAGRASAADVAEVELRLVRQRDHRDAHRTAARAALARLRAVAGLAPGDGPGDPLDAALPAAAVGAADGGAAIDDGGPTESAGVPAVDDAALVDALRAHPDLLRLGALARADDARARARAAEGLPDLGVGLDWIETGEAVIPNQDDSGKDAVIVGVSMRVPLQRGAYDAEAGAARAEADARRAEREAALLAARARLADVLAAIEDADRRLRLVARDLLPRARAAWEGRLARYAAAGTPGGDLNGAIRAAELSLELAREAVRLRAAHGVAWAGLEALVGRPVPRRGDPGASQPEASDPTGGDPTGGDPEGGLR